MAEQVQQTNNPSGSVREKFTRKDQLSVAEYKALQEKETKKEAKRFKIPAAVKTALMIPFILIALLGVFFISYLGIQMFSSPAKTTSTK